MGGWGGGGLLKSADGESKKVGESDCPEGGLRTKDDRNKYQIKG